MRVLGGLAVYRSEMADSPARCPDCETLAAYIDGRHSLVERARLESHLALCPTCIAVVAGVARTISEVSASLPDIRIEGDDSRANRRSVLAALAAVAAVLMVVVLPPSLRTWLNQDSRPSS